VKRESLIRHLKKRHNYLFAATPTRWWLDRELASFHEKQHHYGGWKHTHKKT